MHRFVVFIACSIRDRRLNTGVDFERRPANLSTVVRTGEELYTPDLRLQMRDPKARFTCVACMMFNVRLQQWEEITDVASLTDGTQLFLFDANGTGFGAGALPRVDVILKHHEVARASESANAARNEDLNQSEARTATRRLGSSNLRSVPPPVSVEAASRPQRSYPGSEAGADAPSSAGPSNVANKMSNPVSQLPPGTRRFMFDQLCRRSGQPDSVGVPLLHSVCIENGLLFSTDDFADIMQNRSSLDWAAFEELSNSFGPMVDVLYDRIWSRTTSRAAQQQQLQRMGGILRDTARIRGELDDLEEEERQLTARLAAIHATKLGLQKELREEEKRERETAPNGTEDRQKESEMLNRFVALRLRWLSLRREEERVSHQLSLLQ